MALSPSKIYPEILRGDFNAFVHRSFLELNGQKRLLHNWHHEVIASKLEDVRLGRCRRLIINMQPRLLKSHTTTICFPAWLLGHNPAMEIMCVSLEQSASERFARVSRKLMLTPFYQAIFDTRLSEDKNAVEEFETTKGGGRFSTSVSGTVTSRGGDVIILDDPIKPDEAISDARRNSLNDWYDNTLRNRQNYQEKSAIIIVMQRLHSDDLVAHVQKGEKWDVFPKRSCCRSETKSLIGTTRVKSA